MVHRKYSCSPHLLMLGDLNPNVWANKKDQFWSFLFALHQTDLFTASNHAADTYLKKPTMICLKRSPLVSSLNGICLYLLSFTLLKNGLSACWTFSGFWTISSPGVRPFSTSTFPLSFMPFLIFRFSTSQIGRAHV